VAETLAASARHQPTATSSSALRCPNRHRFECCWRCLCWSPVGGPIGCGGGGGRWWSPPRRRSRPCQWCRCGYWSVRSRRAGVSGSLACRRWGRQRWEKRAENRWLGCDLGFLVVEQEGEKRVVAEGCLGLRFGD